MGCWAVCQTVSQLDPLAGRRIHGLTYKGGCVGLRSFAITNAEGYCSAVCIVGTVSWYLLDHRHRLDGDFTELDGPYTAAGRDVQHALWRRRDRGEM